MAAAAPSPLQKGLNEAEVYAAVEAEGLTLLPSFQPDSSSGFRGVTVRRSNCFQANWRTPGEATNHYIGSYPTALEAALHVARYLGRDASAAAAARPAEATAPRGMSDAEVWAAVEAEGLTLIPSSDHRSGFRGVGAVGAYGSRYQANSSDGRMHYLGRFGTALEAASTAL